MVTGYEHDQWRSMISIAKSLHKIAEELIIANEKLERISGAVELLANVKFEESGRKV